MSRFSLQHSCAFFALSAGLALMAPAAFAQSADNPLTDIITVSTPRLQSPTRDQLDPQEQPVIAAPDTTHLLARLPGAAAVANGALSGQLQYRGLFGPRLNIRVNDQMIASGGPNLMDPPLHYAPSVLVERIEFARGVSPVSDGPGLGGGFDASLITSTFTDQAGFSLSHTLTLAARSADASSAIGGLVGLSNDNLRVHVLGSHETGGDRETPYGTIHGSAYERSVYGFGAAWRSGSHTLSVDLRRNETGRTGNPPFSMDIRFIDTDTARIAYRGAFDSIRLDLAAGWSDVGHGMNNFSLRPAPGSPMMWRETFAYAESRTLSAALALAAMGGELRAGIDHADIAHDVTITNPMNADFYLHNLPDIDLSRTGAFVEWGGPMIAGWQGELGLRVDRHEASAGLAATGSAVPAMPGMLAMVANMADRDWQGSTLDAALRLWRPLSETVTVRLNLARKTRAPGYLERFAWLPTAASGGLADGNTYVGDLELEPETAWIAEAGLDWSNAQAYARPTLFIRRIDDYIQGVPFDATPGLINSPVEMVSAMNGDPTPLRFANVDAELFGLDANFGYRIDAHWRLDGAVSWVRGKRRDIKDDLYRIAPAHLRIGASYDAETWTVTLESLATARQDDVSLANGETATPGQVVANLYGRWDVRPGVSLALGVENLLDQPWRDHLAGVNRNAGSDIGLGERLPGYGRSFGLRLAIRG
ncbi:TonB-dependent receptor [Maricaulis maris MCS10]|uniref:TonB-dependent receptor n=1 Tax=Maricaulis maris (strain MCS10) TaxID=394221 RepID=Q0AQU1_MARMM|nr:TonB-dependent receptor [Maricaulis maris]ABI65346.1 TonB-dependent receptor [Maricaulis maris MCS10]